MFRREPRLTLRWPSDPPSIQRALGSLAVRFAAADGHPDVLIESTDTGVEVVGVAPALSGGYPEAARHRVDEGARATRRAEGALPGPECFLVFGAPPDSREPPHRESPVRSDPRIRPPGSPPPFDPLLRPSVLSPRDWSIQTHWSRAGRGTVRVALRARVGTSVLHPWVPEVAGAMLDRLASLGVPGTVSIVTGSRRRRREWRTGAWKVLRPVDRFRVLPSVAARIAMIRSSPPPRPAELDARHTVLFGASGSGKSAYLVELLRARLEVGRPSLAFDLHGDLGPRLAAVASPWARGRLIALDAAGPVPLPGVDLLGREAGIPPETARAHMLAALKRLGADEGGTYWGFRLDRIFDTFLAVVQEERGDLRDLYGLLVDADRRDLARRSTRSADTARFLEELPAILRRNPEFLWPAAARLSRVVLSERLSALVAPTESPVPVERLLTDGATVLWRLPMGALGPEGATFAATLLIARWYLGRLASGSSARGLPEVALVLDEAHAISPRLLAEILADGRKFGVAVHAATQYPDRLDAEVRAAAAAAVGVHLVFRTPPAEAAVAGRWVGLGPEEASHRLPELPDGVAVEFVSGPGGVAVERAIPLGGASDPRRWSEAVASSHAEFGSARIEPDGARAPAEERILLSLLAAGAEGGNCSLARLAAELDGAVDPAALPGELARLAREGLVVPSEGGFGLSARGELELGFSSRTGASPESAEHRALLLEAFVLFARCGHRIEILRQGRFDTRLPDAWLRWTMPDSLASTPAERWSEMERWRETWAWRQFGGRDVHLEAEVSGADRPERIRHNLAKGRRAAAFVLFLVADDRRAARVRATIGPARRGTSDTAVWTLRRAARVRREGGSARSSAGSA